jgi:hypothetical protein
VPKPEAAVQKAVLDLLAAKKILAFRNNVGSMQGSHKGKRWFVRFGVTGMADVVAYPKRFIAACNWTHVAPLWIECKAPTKKQTTEQTNFQKLVESHGHAYIVVDDIDKLIQYFNQNGI